MLKNSPDVPQGTYLDSCKGCSLQENDRILACTHCLGRGNVPFYSKIELKECENETNICNNFGKLSCEEPEEEVPLPTGPYLETCKRCYYIEKNLLSCKCLDGLVYSSITYLTVNLFP